MKLDAFYQPNILGGAIEYDVDLKDVECGCNAALYLFKAGKHAGPAGDYYCDASNGNGSMCPEMDMMEANKHAFRITPHKCDAPNAQGEIFNCDRGGCGKSIYSIDPKAYGPGYQFRIDTNKKFHVSISFNKV
jgi:hypothetical protein